MAKVFGPEGTCGLCWLEIFLVYCHCVSAFSPHSQAFRAWGLTLGLGSPCTCSTQSIAGFFYRGLLLKHFRAVTLVLSKIITFRAVLLGLQLNHLSLCRTRAWEMGTAGTRRIG